MEVVTQARVTLTDLSASLEGLDTVVDEEVPGVIADVRTATQTAKQVISTAGADVTEFTTGLKPLTATANTTLETATRTLHDASATLTLKDVTDFLVAQKFTRQYLPEYLEVLPAMPRTPSGKIQKFKLREMAKPIFQDQQAHA